jgi:hypothetical protein
MMYGFCLKMLGQGHASRKLISGISQDLDCESIVFLAQPNQARTTWLDHFGGPTPLVFSFTKKQICQDCFALN